MEVIKSGDVDWSVERECNSCHAVLKVTQKDLRYNGNGYDPKFHFNCQQCGMKNELPAELNIPAHAKQRLRDNYNA